jgi:hypothetical protein
LIAECWTSICQWAAASAIRVVVLNVADLE